MPARAPARQPQLPLGENASVLLLLKAEAVAHGRELHAGDLNLYKDTPGATRTVRDAAGIVEGSVGALDPYRALGSNVDGGSGRSMGSIILFTVELHWNPVLQEKAL